MRDGVRRAVDYYRPLGEGSVGQPMPVVYQSQRYVRAWRLPDGQVETPLGRADRDGLVVLPERRGAQNYLAWFAINGYVVVVADMRGAGASFGPQVEQNSLEACRDEFDVIEWIAEQPWCDGTVAMSGISYGAESQLMAASFAPPALKAIAPSAPEIDRFHGEAFVMGGVYRHGWQNAWHTGTRARNAAIEETLPRTICPVDDDPEGLQLAEAVGERGGEESRAREAAAQADWQEGVAGERFWDRIPYSRSFQEEGPNHSITFVDALNAAGVPVFLTTGWLDLYTAGNTRLFNALTVPKKLVIGPWAHGPGGTEDGEEGPRGRAYLETLEKTGLRWFDYWLRGIENGIVDEPPVSYAVLGGQQRWAWRSAPSWPPPGSRYTDFYLAPTLSPSVDSVNDGGLTSDRTILESAPPFDEYRVDYGASTGRDNRWFAGGSADARAAYGDLREKVDRHGATYTTEPFESELTIVGHPVLTLYATSDAADLDFIAFLERVEADGSSSYVTEGALRASHRVLGTPPYGYAGLPFPDSSSSVVGSTPPLSSGVAELTFELYPIAITYRPGERLRLSIVHIDDGNTATPRLTPAPHVTIFRSSRYRSRVELPLMPYEDRSPGEVRALLDRA
jgi:putative CocE/NonD family hydrolase